MLPLSRNQRLFFRATRRQESAISGRSRLTESGPSGRHPLRADPQPASTEAAGLSRRQLEPVDFLEGFACDTLQVAVHTNGELNGLPPCSVVAGGLRQN